MSTRFHEKEFHPDCWPGVPSELTDVLLREGCDILRPRAAQVASCRCEAMRSRLTW